MDKNHGAPHPSQVEMEVLRLLGTKTEMYGLEMVKTSKKLKRGTIYVSLFRMEEKGWLTSRAEQADDRSGSPRRLYQISGLGLRVKMAAEAAASTFSAAGAIAQGA